MHTPSLYQVSGLMGHSSIKVTEDYYVKGFDMKATLRDFPSLKKYLITPKNEQIHRGAHKKGHTNSNISKIPPRQIRISALDWGSRGRRFKSFRSDSDTKLITLRFFEGFFVSHTSTHIDSHLATNS